MGLLSHQTTPQWIIDCGATDIMTLDPRDLKSVKPTTFTYIQTANGECVQVKQVGPVDISYLACLINYCLLAS